MHSGGLGNDAGRRLIDAAGAVDVSGLIFGTRVESGGADRLRIGMSASALVSLGKLGSWLIEKIGWLLNPGILTWIQGHPRASPPLDTYPLHVAGSAVGYVGRILPA